MNDRTAENIPLNSSQKDDLYPEVRRDMSSIFYEHNLDLYTNPKDVGFIDINKYSQKSDLHDFDETPNPYEVDRSISKGDLSGAVTPIQAVNKYISFSPYKGNKSQPDHLNPFSGLHLLHKGMDSTGGTPLKFIDKRADAYPHYDSMQFESNSQDYKEGIKQEYIDSYGDEGLTAMWSSEPAKVTKMQKINGFDDTYPKGRKAYAPLQHYDSYENYEDKPSQDNEIYAPLPLKPEINKFSRPPEHDEDKGPIVRIPKPNNIVVKKESTKRESASKYNPPDYDDDKDDDLGDGKNRSSRGLRVLSLKVKDIVNEKKKTSYKEVAETLIKELNRKHRAQSNGSGSKDEQNVKRRVYDALNVLIAADILKKEGKSVFCDESVANLGLHRRKKMKEEKERLEKDIIEIKKRNKGKIEHIQELAFKFLAIKNLITRNKQREQAIQAKPSEKPVTDGKPSASTEEQQQVAQGNLIHFPFIVVASSAVDNNINLNMDKANKQLLIESKNSLNILGDIDVLLKMKLHRVSKKFFEENISQDMRRYIPSSFQDDLK